MRIRNLSVKRVLLHTMQESGFVLVLVRLVMMCASLCKRGVFFVSLSEKGVASICLTEKCDSYVSYS